MKRKETKKIETSVETPAETPHEDKRKKLKIRITTTSILFAICIIMVIGISGFSFHIYIKTNPGFCSTCHNMASHVTSYLTSNHMDNVHAQAGVMCKDCHSDFTVLDETQSLVKYVTGDYKKVFTKRKYGDDMCLQCHISMEHLAMQTSYLVRNPHASHWPDLKCVTCHISHGNQVNYCAQCHENGGQRMIEKINSKSASQ
jgi:nitrate/TMAO reductase-like tetraheme cytochrome c subunit